MLTRDELKRYGPCQTCAGAGSVACACPDKPKVHGHPCDRCNGTGLGFNNGPISFTPV